MSISTYSELQSATANWLARTNLNAFIPDLIMIGEKWIFRRARVRSMETALSFTISGGAGIVPSDFIAIKHARTTGSPTVPMRPRPTSWILEQYPNRSASSRPRYIGVDGSSFIFGPFPDAEYDVEGIYYAKPQSIADVENDVFIDNPDIYLFATLAESVMFIKDDPRVALWTAKRDQILADMNEEATESARDVGQETALG